MAAIFQLLNKLIIKAWQAAMNIDQLVVPDSLSLNLSRKYFDLGRVISGYSIKEDKF